MPDVRILPVTAPDRPIYAITRDLLADASAAVRMLRAQAEELPLFERGGMLVEVAHTGQIVPLAPDRIRDVLARAAIWVRLRGGDGEEPAAVPTYPPRDVASTLAARTAWGLPELAGVVSHPWIRCEGAEAGEVVSLPGYDPTSRTYGTWDSTLGREAGSVADGMTPEQAAAELEDLIADFRFASTADRASALAGWLTAAARPGIAGDVPLWLVEASTPGSGKGTLCDLVLRSVYPTATRRTPWVSDDAELSKALLALALAGEERILWDNVDGIFGGPALDAAITSAATGYRGRMLGQSRIVSAPLRPFWVANGNNVQIKGDIHRRILVTRLDPGTDRPEDRTDYRYPGRLLEVAAARRARTLGACLRLLRLGLANPGPMGGGFPVWSAVVRGALVAVGYPDPWSAGSDLRELARASSLVDVLEAWDRIWGASAVRARDLAEAVTDPPAQTSAGDAYSTLADLLLEVAADSRVRGRLSTRRLGQWLARVRDRVVATPGGHRLVLRRLPRSGAGVRWNVERLP
ncbi:MAG: hypothetical protein ACO3RX_01830 [Chthoniobacterales bacterium]